MLHAKPEDYVILLDHHEDVVVLDSATNPTRVRAFQVKTKDKGNWTIGALLKRKPSKKKTSPGLPSILGKLYDVYQRFQYVDSLSFVSNASFSLKLANTQDSTSLDTVPLTYVHSSVDKKVKESLATELSLPSAPTGLHLVELQRTALVVTDHETHARGRLAEFMEKQGFSTGVLGAVYRTLQGEVDRRSRKEGTFTSFDELCQAKAITRSWFADALKRTTAATLDDLPKTLRSRLDSEGVSFADVDAVARAAASYVVERLDPTRSLLSQAAATVRAALGDPASLSGRLWDTILKVDDTVKSSLADLTLAYSVAFRRALIGVCIYERLNESVQTPGSTPAGGTSP